MKLGKYFDSLVDSTIRVAKCIQSDNTTKQFDFLCKNVFELSKNLQDFSKITNYELETVLKKSSKYYKYKTIPLGVDHNKNLLNQISFAKVLNNNAEVLISIAKQLQNTDVTTERYLNFTKMFEQLHNAIEILRYSYERYHLNKKIYSHDVDGKQLQQLVNQLSAKLNEFIPIITRYKNIIKR